MSTTPITTDPSPVPQIRRRWVMGASLLAALALTGACGGGKGQEQAAPRAQPAAERTSQQQASPPTQPSDDGDTGTKAADPCALLTQQQTIEAFGKAPGAPYREDKDRTPGADVLTAQTCIWTVGSDTPKFGSGMPYIRISIQPDYVYNSYHNRENTPVSGIGDEAFDYEGTLYFKKGDRYFSVYLGAMDDGPRATVAQHVLENS